MTTHRIFGFWTGDNVMPDVRRQCWDSFGLTGLDPTLVTADSLGRWVVPSHPLHPAYQYLSPVHRSDYLRPYFMLHHGGGYADIKRQTGTWVTAIDRVLKSSRLIGAGYREIRGGTVWLQNNVVDGKTYVLSQSVPRFAAKLATDAMRAARPLMIGNCAFYFKPGTRFARRWLAEAERRLDRLLPDLRAHPAQGVRERIGDASGYPLPWSFIQGDILCPLSLLYAGRLSRELPRPSFVDYDPLFFEGRNEAPDADQPELSTSGGALPRTTS